MLRSACGDVPRSVRLSFRCADLKGLGGGKGENGNGKRTLHPAAFLSAKKDQLHSYDFLKHFLNPREERVEVPSATVGENCRTRHRNTEGKGKAGRGRIVSYSW